MRATTEATASLHAIGTATTQRRNGPFTAPPATTSHTPEIPPTSTTTLFPSPIPANCPTEQPMPHATDSKTSRSQNLTGFTNSPPFRISPPVINVKVLEAVKINNLHCSPPDPPVINVKVLEAVKINNLHCSPPENTQSPTLGGRGTPGRQDIRPRRAGSGRDRGNSDGGNGVGSAACTDPRRDIRRQHNGRRSAH